MVLLHEASKDNHVLHVAAKVLMSTNIPPLTFFPWASNGLIFKDGWAHSMHSRWAISWLIWMG
jgi:hypothetical protein